MLADGKYVCEENISTDVAPLDKGVYDIPDSLLEVLLLLRENVHTVCHLH